MVNKIQWLFRIGESDVHAHTQHLFLKFTLHIYIFFRDIWTLSRVGSSSGSAGREFRVARSAVFNRSQRMKNHEKDAKLKRGVATQSLGFKSDYRVVYLLKTWLSSSNCQPWLVSNEERVGAEGPHQGNFSSWRLLRLLSRPPYIPVCSGLSASISHLFSYHTYSCIFAGVCVQKHYERKYQCHHISIYFNQHSRSAQFLYCIHFVRTKLFYYLVKLLPSFTASFLHSSDSQRQKSEEKASFYQIWFECSQRRPCSCR